MFAVTFLPVGKLGKLAEESAIVGKLGKLAHAAGLTKRAVTLIKSAGEAIARLTPALTKLADAGARIAESAGEAAARATERALSKAKTLARERRAAKLPEALTVGRNAEQGVGVYRGVSNGEQVYSGITNDLERRALQHGDRFSRLVDLTESGTVSRGEARAIEQALIVRDVGENLRNEISPLHPWYQQAVDWGEAWLQQAACRMSAETNLQPLKRSRMQPKPGDVFAMLLPEGRYLFGRVILADLPRGKAPMPTSNLIYIYDVQAREKVSPPLHSLTPERLLLAPQFVNRLPWSKGYFESVAYEPLVQSDLLRRHCFWDAVRKIYRDETGEIIAERSEPCGEWGLGSYRMMDDLVSDALGIPRVPT